MKSLPDSSASHGVTFTVADFIEAGRERLELEVAVGGEGLQRTIGEPVMNRPGLALTGFWENFAWRRLQLFGNAEMAYLGSIDNETRIARFIELVKHKAHILRRDVAEVSIRILVDGVVHLLRHEWLRLVLPGYCGKPLLVSASIQHKGKRERFAFGTV